MSLLQKKKNSVIDENDAILVPSTSSIQLLKPTLITTNKLYSYLLRTDFGVVCHPNVNSILHSVTLTMEQEPIMIEEMKLTKVWLEKQVSHVRQEKNIFTIDLCVPSDDKNDFATVPNEPNNKNK